MCVVPLVVFVGGKNIKVLGNETRSCGDGKKCGMSRLGVSVCLFISFMTNFLMVILYA